MSKSRLFCALLTIGLQSGLLAQTLSSISSTYSDDLTEWELFAYEELDVVDSTALADGEAVEAEEVRIGRLNLLWPMKQDALRDWQYDIDGKRGTIRQKWTTDKTHWELSDADSRITMQPTWPGEVRNWRITDNHITLTLQCRYGNVADEWLVDDSRYGTFFMYTDREGDPRDWVIRNKLSADVPQGMQMALAFIVLYFSTLN
jgi:hypothetical protein